MADKKTIQHYKDHQVILGMIIEATERVEKFRLSLKRGHTITDEEVEDFVAHLREMRKKEEAHIESTYTVLAGTRESVYAKHGDKLIGAVVTVILALIGAFGAIEHKEAVAPAMTIEVKAPEAP